MAFKGKWAPPINLTKNLYNMDNRYPSVAIEYQYYDATGAWHNYNRIHVVWQALPPNGPRYEVFYANLWVGNPPGAPPAWTTVKNLSNTLFTDSLVPAIAINKNTTVTNQHLHVVWQEEDIYSGGMAPPQEDSWFSNIAYIRSIDSGVSWAGPAGGWGGYAWDNLTHSPSNSQMPSISCILDQYTYTPGGKSGDLGYNSVNVHVSFNEDTSGGINVFYLRSPNDGVNWNPRVNVTMITGGTGYDAYSNIAVDMLDNPHIVFMRNNMGRREPLRTVPGSNYLPGINPIQWWAFPGPEIGMGNAIVPNSVTYAYYDGLNWTWKGFSKNLEDKEFPTVALDRWQHVNVNWQEYTCTGDYEIMRTVNLNINPPQFPLLLQKYADWGLFINDSNDPANDDFFPNLAHKKVPMYMSPSGPNVAGFDEVWTKISGHGPAGPIAPVAKKVMQDGNMKYDAGL